MQMSRNIKDCEMHILPETIIAKISVHKTTTSTFLLLLGDDAGSELMNRVKHMRYPGEKATKTWLYLILFIYTMVSKNAVATVLPLPLHYIHFHGL